MSRISAFETMARDIGVRRYQGEDDLSFCARTAYSASRYWTAAFCMDDGRSGARGITRQVLSRRLNRWMSSLDQIMPGLGEWFETSGTKDMRWIYGRLIDVGDILLAGEEGRCVARSVTLRPVSEGSALALGFFEPATVGFAGGMVTSGLTSFVSGQFEAPGRCEPWWETDCPFMAWTKASDYGEVQFIDPSVHRWGLANSDSWTGGGLGKFRISLARYVDRNSNEPHYLAVRRSGKHELASRVDRHMAQELLIHLKEESGNPIVITFEDLDNRHFKTKLPISILPQQISATVDALSWPVGNVSSNADRIFRTETADVVREMLAPYGIKISDNIAKGMKHVR